MKSKKRKYKLRKLNPEEVWNQYEKMITGIALKLSYHYSKPFDEVLSEGIFSVFKKLSNWNPKRSKLCTYVNLCAKGAMLTYCIKPQREIPMDTYETGKRNPFIQKETKPSWFQTFFNELTEETKHLIKIVFESPEELYEGIRPNRPKTSQTKLKNYMIDVLDWTSKDVSKAFKEVSKCL